MLRLSNFLTRSEESVDTERIKVVTALALNIGERLLV